MSFRWEDRYSRFDRLAELHKISYRTLVRRCSTSSFHNMLQLRCHSDRTLRYNQKLLQCYCCLEYSVHAGWQSAKMPDRRESGRLCATPRSVPLACSLCVAVQLISRVARVSSNTIDILTGNDNIQGSFGNRTAGLCAWIWIRPRIWIWPRTGAPKPTIRRLSYTKG